MSNTREYAALPHEYLEEMEMLSDAEFGRLVRSLLAYSREGTPIALSGNERFYAVRVMNREDRYQESFRDSSQQKSEAGKLGASARWQNNGKNGTAISANGKNGYTETNTETKANTNAEAEESEKAHARGEYGWVKLTDQQYSRLLEDLGEEELARCIRYIDESAQSSGNKNKWSDWNLVVRRCHREGWGLGPSRQNNSPNARPASGKSLTSEEQVKKYGAHSPAEIRALVDRI